MHQVCFGSFFSRCRHRMDTVSRSTESVIDGTPISLLIHSRRLELPPGQSDFDAPKEGSEGVSYPMLGDRPLLTNH